MIVSHLINMFMTAPGGIGKPSVIGEHVRISNQDFWSGDWVKNNEMCVSGPRA